MTCRTMPTLTAHATSSCCSLMVQMMSSPASKHTYGRSMGVVGEEPAQMLDIRVG